MRLGLQALQLPLARRPAVGQLAQLGVLPGWVAGLSPYSHVPKVPAEPLRVMPELGLTLLATLLLITAWWRYRERDIG
jgi:ABC-2 type transport system permease protein